MIEYISRKAKSHSEKVIRRNMLKIFMERLTGEIKNMQNSALSMEKNRSLKRHWKFAINMMMKMQADITQRIYRKKINNTL